MGSQENCRGLWSYLANNYTYILLLSLLLFFYYIFLQLAAIGSKSGVAKLLETHPSVAVFVGAIDDNLTTDGLITPGIGDAGSFLSK